MFYSKINGKIVLSEGDPSKTTSAFIGDIKNYGFANLGHKHNDYVSMLSDVSIDEDLRYPLYLAETAKFIEVNGLASIIATKIGTEHVHDNYISDVTIDGSALKGSIVINVTGVDSVTQTAADEITISTIAAAGAESNGFRNVNTMSSNNGLEVTFDYQDPATIYHQQICFDRLPRN